MTAEEREARLTLFQALSVAMNSSEPGERNIFHSTRAIMFFSTPHRGGGGAALANDLANIGKAILRNPIGHGALGNLKAGAPHIGWLTQDFRAVVVNGGIRCVSIFELDDTKRFWVIFFHILKFRVGSCSPTLRVRANAYRIFVGGQRGIGNAWLWKGKITRNAC
jgi:hypothetical protein